MSNSWWLSECLILQSKESKTVIFGDIGHKRKRESEDEEDQFEDDYEDDQPESFAESDSDDFDFGHGQPGAVAFSSLEDAVAALSKKFGRKAVDPAQAPKAPPLDDQKSFAPPNKS